MKQHPKTRFGLYMPMVRYATTKHWRSQWHPVFAGWMMAAMMFASAVPSCLAEVQVFDAGGQSPEKENATLTALLESDAPLFDKTLACKRLAIIGNDRAVPTLAELLTDAELSHFARHALETIPGPAADESLRDGLARVQGRQLLGVINSVGVRQDGAAAPKLGSLLESQDDAVAAAAAAALARIATAEAADLLLTAIAEAPAARQAAMRDAGLRCAERLAAKRDVDRARKLYEAIDSAESPRHVRLAAALGFIRATSDADLAKLLAEYLVANDDVKFEAAVYASHGRGGSDVTTALAAALAGAAEAQQVYLLDALRSRGDASVASQVAEVVERGTPAVKTAAIACLGEVGDRTSVPLLVMAATDSDPQVAMMAAASLAGLAGNGVDEELLRQLAGADPVRQHVVVELLGRRRVKSATPALFELLGSGDEATFAALEALAQTVDEKSFAKLLDRIPAAEEDAERVATINAVNAACRRMPDAEVVVALVADRLTAWPADDRPALLNALGAVGGKSALDLVASTATKDFNGLEDAATRVLGEWMTPDAAPVLYEIAASDHRFKVRALRGYIRVARQLNLEQEERLKMCGEALKIAERPAERELVLEVLSRCPSPAAIELASGLLEDESLRPKAAETVVLIAEKIKDQHPAAASAAAQQALEAGLSDGLAERAQALVKPN